MANDAIEGNEQATYVALPRISMTYHGITYQARACAVSHDAASLVQPGRTRGIVLGSTAYPESKDNGGKEPADNAMITRRRVR